MRQLRMLLLLLAALVVQCFGQEMTLPPDWNGDPDICTPNSSPFNPNDPAYPQFPVKAEFTVEQIEIRHILNETERTRLILTQILYDQQANSAIIVKNSRGFIDVEYFYYKIAQKSTYYRGEYCVVTPIPTEVDVGKFKARDNSKTLLLSS